MQRFALKSRRNFRGSSQRPKVEPNQSIDATLAPASKPNHEGTTGRSGQRNVRYYKCNKMGHISSYYLNRQNTIVGTSMKGKELMSDHESEDKSDDDGKEARSDDDGEEEVLGDKAETLMILRHPIGDHQVENHEEPNDESD